METKLAMRLVPLFAIALAACIAIAGSASAGVAELDVVGTGDGIDLLRALGSDFGSDNNAVRVNIPPSIGSGGAIAAVGAGKATVGRVARKLTASEVASGLVYRPFAVLPSAFFVHPGVGVSGLTAAQLQDIYSGRISNWSATGGPDLRIRVVRREDTDSTLTVLREMMPGWKSLKITDLSKTATTTQEAIETVRDVRGAIGFGPYSSKLDPDVKVLRIDGLHPLDPKYPSHVELALIYKEASIGPEDRKFVSYLHSERARQIMSGLGSVPVSP
jgi:phosphate transport system substrate-binding protein